MSFRASHYFISFISEASAVASGFGCQRASTPQGVTKWEVPVTEPHNIEVPRSLVDVVVSWNIPMHKWLKQCKFRFLDLSILSIMSIHCVDFHQD